MSVAAATAAAVANTQKQLMDEDLWFNEDFFKVNLISFTKYLLFNSNLLTNLLNL